MPIFGRRKMQDMLDQLGPALPDDKVCDLINRIESKEINQALPGEMELGLVWAISQIGPVEIEPDWYGTSGLPDAYSEHLIPGHETIIEISALSDAALPSDEGMRNASRKISHEANRIRKGSGLKLSYYFYEASEWKNGEALRWVCVPRNLVITPYVRGALEHWIKHVGPVDGEKIRLKESELDVVITWHDRDQSQYNFHTSMPPEIRSLKKNYLYGSLYRKGKQLRSPNFGGTRCVILADVGSTALRRIDDRDYTGRVISGKQIIDAYLDSAECELDVVVVVSPNRGRKRMDSLEETIDWKTTVFCTRSLKIDLSGLRAMTKVLPRPSLEGYQARQLHEQNVFSPQSRGRYLGTSVMWEKGVRSEIRFSARALLDTLAGREKPERFVRMLGGENNVFKGHLDRGETIASIRLEAGSPDEDDDVIVVEFGDDPAARPLAAPES